MIERYRIGARYAGREHRETAAITVAARDDPRLCEICILSSMEFRAWHCHLFKGSITGRRWLSRDDSQRVRL
jgi:hypothetical protein